MHTATVWLFALFLPSLQLPNQVWPAHTTLLYYMYIMPLYYTLHLYITRVLRLYITGIWCLYITNNLIKLIVTVPLKATFFKLCDSKGLSFFFLIHPFFFFSYSSFQLQIPLKYELSVIITSSRRFCWGELGMQRQKLYFSPQSPGLNLFHSQILIATIWSLTYITQSPSQIRFLSWQHLTSRYPFLFS